MEYQSDRESFASSAFCRSLCALRVPVMFPHTPDVMPKLDVATKSYPPEELPRSSCPYEGAVEVPVPPFVIPRMPVTSEVRFTSAVEITPAVALRNPENDPRTSDDARKFVVDALSAERYVVVACVAVAFVALTPVRVAFVAENAVAKRFVDVAFVAVALETLRPPEKVDDAETMRPTVVVGASAPPVSSKACPNDAPDPPIIPSDEVATHCTPEAVACNT